MQQLPAARSRPRVDADRIGERSLGGLEPPQLFDPAGDNLSRTLAFPFFAHAALRLRRLRIACQRKNLVDFVTDRI
ncbi:MAG TPA: hypothetical protein VF997_23555 [Polyangia bacterium]